MVLRYYTVLSKCPFNICIYNAAHKELYLQWHPSFVAAVIFLSFFLWYFF